MMQGLALSHRFWEEVARPKIETDLPDVLPHLAAGLLRRRATEFLFHFDAPSHLPGTMMWPRRHALS